MSEASAPSAHADLVLAFTNSVDHELATDELSTPAALDDWLLGRGLLPDGSRGQAATAADLELARRLRDGLHEALVANHDRSAGAGGSAGQQSAGRLGEVAADLPLRLTTGGAEPALLPVHPGVRGALSHVLVAVTATVADGSWRRLKICASSECAWAYYDASKNRSRLWCEWGCGNRIKSRNYRDRQKA